ncbi:hypothetical protein CspHIS471_0700780 [Cutaneotrichosporon sp. HIS471]|nr:hypothetical protein CspHIS471_0700780 [Cutaneotrichosporon sp. HIS471]
MVLRKPRRNPKTTAEALEALFFPKTIDSIFAQAPRATLFVLRRVCKNWKYRADGCLVRHVVLNGRSKPTSPHGMIPRPNWHTTKLISNVTYLDVSRGPLPKWTKKLSGVLALRRKEIGPDGKFIRDGVRRVIDNEGSVPKEKRDEVLSALTFISLAEYGKKVGEQQLRFETELVYD